MKLDGVHQFTLLDGARITVTNAAGSVEIKDVLQRSFGTRVGDREVDGAGAAKDWGRGKLMRAPEITNVR